MQYQSRFALFALVGMAVALSQTAGPLPLPKPVLPTEPLLPSMVITAQGQRLLLSETDVQLTYEVNSNQLSVNRPGWWVINFPLDRILGLEGKSLDEVSALIFNQPFSSVRNWYVKSPGTPTPEPAPSVGPAPAGMAANPTVWVDNLSRNASDSNNGSAGAPLRTISAAVSAAQAGTTIRVRPGVYREQVVVTNSGTAGQPIRVEGERDANGNMPVISGNVAFPDGSWQPAAGFPDVYRAPIFTGREGAVSAFGGNALVERSHPSELKEGEYCFNHGSSEFLQLRFDGNASPIEGEQASTLRWTRLSADSNGVLDLGAKHGFIPQGAVFWLSSYFWVTPASLSGWTPDLAATVTGGMTVYGSFRAFRATGLNLTDQGNPYRVWLNGGLLPATVFSTATDPQLLTPHPSRNFGNSDDWTNVSVREGWNHIVVELDTSLAPVNLQMLLLLPREAGNLITLAVAPASPAYVPTGAASPYLSEFLVLGPLPSDLDRGVYVRLPGGQNPNQVAMDLAAPRDSELLKVKGDFVEVRGFDIRYGSQFQQRGQVLIEGQGDVLEGNFLRRSENAGVVCAANRDQNAAPTIIRNNWILDPGDVGIGCVGSSEFLTADNLENPAPGRSPILVENNTIVNSNWAAFDIGWSAGGSKSVVLTGALYRYNNLIGGSGPGIWLDWETYGNRIEGNRFESPTGYSVGIEASPGPNLIANNLSIQVRPGPTWLRGGILALDSDQTWAVNNTIDGDWNRSVGFDGYTGTLGIDLGRGGNRSTRWGTLSGGGQVYLNNLIVGCHLAANPSPANLVAANFTDTGDGAVSLGGLPPFQNYFGGDYRLQRQSALNRQGVPNQYTQRVHHDFFGLLRFPDRPWSVGAFRLDPLPRNLDQALVELETNDGQLLRLYEDIQ